MVLKTYLSIRDELELCKEELRLVEDQIEHLNELLVGNMGDIKAFDYSKERVQEGSKIKFEDYLPRLGRLMEVKAKHKEHIERTGKELERLNKMLSTCKASHSEVIYCRYALKLTEEQTAERTGYSVRQVRRIDGLYRES